MASENGAKSGLLSVATARKVLPMPVYGSARNIYHQSVNLRYQRFLRQKGIRKERLLIFGTVTRSGLNYGKFMIANYLKLLTGTAEGPVGPAELVAMFPNIQWYLRYVKPRTFLEPTPDLRALGIDDVTHIHSSYWSPYFDGSKVLHLYRNPLDFAVSCFFFYYDNRVDRAGMMSSPVEVLEKHLAEYVEVYQSYQQAARSGKANMLRISYENLITNPEVCLDIILGWLGVEASASLVRTAVEYSSRDTVKLLDDRWPHEQLPNFKGRHINDGSIGQWKTYFDSSDVRRVKARLSDAGINLDDFVLEA